ncbi:MAG: flagellar protein FliT [Sulfuritalea sp.]|nr:flagellar protein FliT [Sulfuritalea sp.]
MPSQIELYEEMCRLSSRMAAAARASDWDHLIELERGIRSLRDALLAIADDGNEAATDLARKHGLIQRILDDDAEVRRHTEPWMERIFYFLGNSQPHRELHLASATESGESTTAG